MSPTKNVRPVAPAIAKIKSIEARHDMGPAQSELAFLLIGGIALVEGLALVLLARKAK